MSSSTDARGSSTGEDRFFSETRPRLRTTKRSCLRDADDLHAAPRANRSSRAADRRASERRPTAGRPRPRGCPSAGPGVGPRLRPTPQRQVPLPVMAEAGRRALALAADALASLERRTPLHPRDRAQPGQAAGDELDLDVTPGATAPEVATDRTGRGGQPLRQGTVAPPRREFVSGQRRAQIRHRQERTLRHHGLLRPPGRLA